MTNLAVVPDANARQGFLPGPSGQLINVGVAPAVRPYLAALFPLPNGIDHGDGSADFLSASSNPTNEDYLAVRLDHSFNENHFVFGRYTFDDGDQGNMDENLLFNVPTTTRYQYANVSFTSLLSPLVLNNFRAGVNRSKFAAISEKSTSWNFENNSSNAFFLYHVFHYSTALTNLFYHSARGFHRNINH